MPSFSIGQVKYRLEEPHRAKTSAEVHQKERRGGGGGL